MIKIILVSVIYIIILFIISPIIDHLFSPLDEEKPEIEIILEIFGQILAVSIAWYIISKYILTFINKKVGGIKSHDILDKSSEIITSVITVGLQSHLIDKLESEIFLEV